jgi:hypothetical protein
VNTDAIDDVLARLTELRDRYEAEIDRLRDDVRRLERENEALWRACNERRDGGA